MPLNLTSDVMPAVLAGLCAVDAADLRFWTESELLAAGGEAAEELARQALLTARPFSTSTVSGQAEYTFPGIGQILLVTVNGQVVQPATPLEMDAWRPDWRTQTGTPTRWVGGENNFTVRLYPTPTAAVSLEVVANARLGTPTSGAPTMSIPDALAPWVVLRILGMARGREGRGAMPDVSAAALSLATVFEALAVSYYGEG